MSMKYQTSFGYGRQGMENNIIHSLLIQMGYHVLMQEWDLTLFNHKTNIQNVKA